jgi:predicted RNase H-like HicB family nuclease
MPDGSVYRAVQERGVTMVRIVNLHIEKLPEGVYLATSTDIQGLVAQGRTIQETLEIARDLAKKLIEGRTEREGLPPLTPTAELFEYPPVVNA